jgi:cytochrome b subunit of formate dehydrogenase
MADQNDDSVRRHAAPDRIFHWVTAATMFVLLGTSLLPIIGIRFAWLVPHGGSA